MKRINCFEWPATAIDDMTVMWNLGKSASEIARAFEQKFDRKFTRNQVIGKLGRLGLTASEGRLKTSRALAGQRGAVRKAKPIKLKASVPGGGASAPSKPMAKATSMPAAAASDQTDEDRSPTIKAMLQYAVVSDQAGVELIDLADDGCRFILGKTAHGIERYCGRRCERATGGRFRPYCSSCSIGKSNLRLSKPKPSADVWDAGRKLTGFRYSRRDGAGNAG